MYFFNLRKRIHTRSTSCHLAAKAGINNFVKFQSEILAKRSIRINAIASGNILFKGSIWKKIKKNKKNVKNFIDKNVPLKNFWNDTRHS